MLDNEELSRIVLPILAADAALYRNYIYRDEAPLDCPIHVYGGETDPNVTREHLETWATHTTAPTSVQQFEGGHFFLQTTQANCLSALANSLK